MFAKNLEDRGLWIAFSAHGLTDQMVNIETYRLVVSLSVTDRQKKCSLFCQDCETFSNR
jgi:hypothetical protein